jgi:hypothetical protein
MWQEGDVLKYVAVGGRWSTDVLAILQVTDFEKCTYKTNLNYVLHLCDKESRFPSHNMVLRNTYRPKYLVSLLKIHSFEITTVRNFCYLTEASVIRARG